MRKEKKGKGRMRRGRKERGMRPRNYNELGDNTRHGRDGIHGNRFNWTIEM